jgi:hypothetical protein
VRSRCSAPARSPRRSPSPDDVEVIAVPSARRLEGAGYSQCEPELPTDRVIQVRMPAVGSWGARTRGATTEGAARPHGDARRRARGERVAHAGVHRPEVPRRLHPMRPRQLRRAGSARRRGRGRRSSRGSPGRPRTRACSRGGGPRPTRSSWRAPTSSVAESPRASRSFARRRWTLQRDFSEHPVKCVRKWNGARGDWGLPAHNVRPRREAGSDRARRGASRSCRRTSGRPSWDSRAMVLWHDDRARFAEAMS